MAISKTKLIEKILAKANNTFTENDMKEMKVAELQTLLVDLNNEELQPEPTVNEEGGIEIPEPIAPLEIVTADAPAAPKAKREGSKRDALYAIFDGVQEAGTNDFKAVAKAALPETSDGVISSYLCYWRKDRNVAATRSFGGEKTAKKTSAQKILDLIVKLYGEDFDINVVAQEVREAASASAVEAAEATTETAE